MRLAWTALFVATVVWPRIGTAQVITRGPYLQNASDRAVSILWRTDTATDSRVTVTEAPGAPSVVFSVSSAEVDHHVRVSGLKPDTRYYYTVGSSTAELAGGGSSHYFETSPAPSATRSIRIWAIGDSGNPSDGLRAVRDAFLDLERREARPADLWLMLGDNAYPDGTDTEYQASVFDVFPPLLQTRPLWSTIGNHDARTQEGAKSGPDMGYFYLRIFSFPTSGEAGGAASGSEKYYSFDYGSVHLVSLDSTYRDGFGTDPSVGGEMLRWLEADLALNRQPWVIAFFHHSPYSRGSHTDDVAARENFVPVLEAGGVDLVLTGHSHSYERSYLIRRRQDGSADNEVLDDGDGCEGGDGPYVKPLDAPGAAGTVYVVAGSASSIAEAPLDHPLMYTSAAALGSLVIDVAEQRMDVRFLREDSSIGDHFTIVKTVASDADAGADGDTLDAGAAAALVDSGPGGPEVVDAGAPDARTSTGSVEPSPVDAGRSPASTATAGRASGPTVAARRTARGRSSASWRCTAPGSSTERSTTAHVLWLIAIVATTRDQRRRRPRAV